MLAVLSGLQKPDAGRVHLAGRDVTHSSIETRFKYGLARTFQHPDLFSQLTVREHLLLAHRLKHAPNRSWIDLLTMSGFRRTAECDDEVDQVIEDLRLTAVANERPSGLPLGVMRIVELGRALASSPLVILLDEPASGLDVAERHKFADVLGSLVADGQCSLLLVEHDVDMMMRLCSEIYVLDFGVLIAHGSPDEIRRNPQVQSAYLGDPVETDPR
jgi:branched-chain amino acid transport system ATP-binding protein